QRALFATPAAGGPARGGARDPPGAAQRGLRGRAVGRGPRQDRGPRDRDLRAALMAKGEQVPRPEPAAVAPPRVRGSFWDAFRSPRLALMLGLGFASGLPNPLTGSTMTAWLASEHVTLT